MRKYNRIINPNADFVKIQLHDRVWGFLWGWGIVVNIDLTKEYPIEVVFANKTHESYNFVGKFYRDINQSLFWDVVHFDIPPCPKIPIMLRTIHDILNTSEGLVEFFGKEIMTTRSKDNDDKMVYSFGDDIINPEWIDQSVHKDISETRKVNEQIIGTTQKEEKGHKVETIEKSIDQIRKVIDVVKPKITEKITIGIKEVQEIRALRGKKPQREIAKIYKVSIGEVNGIQFGKIHKHILNPDKSKYISPKRKFTPEDIQDIRALRGKKSQAKIAKIYKTTHCVISNIQLGRSYNYIPNPDGSSYISPKSRKFTPKEIQEIRALRGVKSHRKIAKIYKMSPPMVSSIQLGKTYSDIPNPDGSSYISPLPLIARKLTPKEVQEIRELIGKKSWAEIAKIYKISIWTVKSIDFEKTYKDVPNPDGSLYIPSSNHKRLDKKLSQKLPAIPDKEIRNIRRFFKEGMDISIIAEHFNRSPSLIYKIVRGRIFKDVLDADGNQYIYVLRTGLSKKLAREIRKSYYEDKMSITNICLKYHVSSDNVIKIIHNLIYRDTGK